MKKTLCLDFDGVLHSYTSGWVAPHFIPDPPVPGAFEFLYHALDHFEVVIFSSRSNQEGGIEAMSTWIEYWARKELTNAEPDWRANRVINLISTKKSAFPTKKPSAFVTLDDRAITFSGVFPPIGELLDFQPWNKRNG